MSAFADRRCRSQRGVALEAQTSAAAPRRSPACCSTTATPSPTGLRHNEWVTDEPAIGTAEDATKPQGRTVQTVEDVLGLLDSLFAADDDRWSDRGAAWWDRFYTDRDRGVPFFRQAPDESLVTWHQDGRLQVTRGGRALDLGCGPGRNAVWLAEQGYEVDAIDLSATAIDWGRERAAAAGVEVTFVHGSVFEWSRPDRYDLVYDSGCFHHLPPHRRVSYRSLLRDALSSGAAFGLACFAAGGMGSQVPDESFYRTGSLEGGLAYSDDDLRRIFGWLEVIELRRMRSAAAETGLFGEDFLWVGLFRRPS
jgi:SAM-dependent methyltransferase